MTELNQITILKPHISLNVSNIDRSVEFYTKLFSTEPVKKRSKYAKFDLNFPNLNLTLNEVSFEFGNSKLSHLGIQVESTKDVKLLEKIWKEKNLITREEDNVVCCYAKQDKAWVKDPDGNEWEAFVVLEDHVYQASSKSVCCA